MKPILVSIYKNVVPDRWQPVGQGGVSLPNNTSYAVIPTRHKTA
jgi:hypothetical protein